jgi:hypothetical protein
LPQTAREKSSFPKKRRGVEFNKLRLPAGWVRGGDGMGVTPLYHISLSLGAVLCTDALSAARQKITPLSRQTRWRKIASLLHSVRLYGALSTFKRTKN